MVKSKSHHKICKHLYNFFFTKDKDEWKEYNFRRENSINKSNFYENKKLLKIDDIDINKILVSKRGPYGTKKSFKSFIGYHDNDMRPLYIKFPKMIGYVKCFDGDKKMSFKVVDQKLLKIY